MSEDDRLMDLAIQLAEKGRGRTSPNPLVGAVLVSEGKIISTGYHHRAGEPHAEQLAIRDAGEQVRGSKLYVTLEPCCIEGRTPACTDIITKSGITDVIIGSLDPNPKVNGKGIQALKEAGINVLLDSRYGDIIARQNETFFKYIITKKPFVLAKMAISLDGRISAGDEERTILTGAKAKLEVHSLRDEYDAVIVGVNTIIHDNPQLTARIEGKQTRNPARVIIDSNARIPMDSRVVKTADRTSTFLATLPGADPSKLEKLNEFGVNIITLKEKEGMVDLEDLLDWMGMFELTGVLLEGGAKLFSGFVSKNLVDKFVFIIAPILIGGDKSVGLLDLDSAIMKRLHVTKAAHIDDDVIIEAYPSRG